MIFPLIPSLVAMVAFLLAGTTIGYMATSPGVILPPTTVSSEERGMQQQQPIGSPVVLHAVLDIPTPTPTAPPTLEPSPTQTDGEKVKPCYEMPQGALCSPVKLPTANLVTTPPPTFCKPENYVEDQKYAHPCLNPYVDQFWIPWR